MYSWTRSELPLSSSSSSVFNLSSYPISRSSNYQSKCSTLPSYSSQWSWPPTWTSRSEKVDRSMCPTRSPRKLATLLHSTTITLTIRSCKALSTSHVSTWPAESILESSCSPTALQPLLFQLRVAILSTFSALSASIVKTVWPWLSTRPLTRLYHHTRMLQPVLPQDRYQQQLAEDKSSPQEAVLQ